MDLRNYYEKVRQADSTLTDDHVVVVSLATPEGGKAGVMTEVPRRVAAKLIAEQRGRAASKTEAAAFHETNRNAFSAWEEQEAANRVQVVVIPNNDLRKKRDRE